MQYARKSGRAVGSASLQSRGGIINPSQSPVDPASRPAEWRWDGFHLRWVLIAPGRGQRPLQYQDPNVFQSDALQASLHCPFCPGHESETPPPVYIDRGSDERFPWAVRIVPNLFGAVGRSPCNELPAEPGEVEAVPAGGVSEVIIETPRHGEKPRSAAEMADFSDEQMAAIFQAYQARARALESGGALPYVCIFKNAGRDAGASLPHAHSQLLGLPFVPPRIIDEQRRTLDPATCFVCRRLADPREGPRTVYADADWVAWAPFAAALPYETWIMPRAHRGAFTAFEKEFLHKGARLLRDVLRALRDLHPGLAYNFTFHSLAEPCGHWHLEVLPRLYRQGGLELATGLSINPVAPELAAASLRDRLP